MCACGRIHVPSEALIGPRGPLQYVHSVAIVRDRLWYVGPGPTQPGLDVRPLCGRGSSGLSVNSVWKDARAHPITMYSDRENSSTWARICRGAWQYFVVGPVRVPIGHNLQQRAIVVYVVVHFVPG